MNHANSFAESIAQLIVAQVAPAELPIFDDLAALYFADPTPPDLSTTSYPDPLSMGLGELLVAVTPAATAVAIYALASFAKQPAAPPSGWSEQQEIWQRTFDYESGLTRLLYAIPPQHPTYSELLVFQARLMENRQQARRYGDTLELQAARFQLLEQLNHLALTTVGESFNALCGMAGGIGPAKWQELHENGFRVARTFGMTEETAEQITNTMVTAFLAVLWGEPGE